MTPGVHVMSMRDYLALPAVSAGLLHTLEARCPRAAWHDSWLNEKRPLRSTTSAQGVGTLAHELLLEGTMLSAKVIEPHLYPNKTGGGIPTGWTNPAIREARDAAIAAGKIPLLPDEVAPIETMVRAARAYVDSLQEKQPAIWRAFQPDGGESEVVILWQERDGTWCKIRPDRISCDRSVLINVKTTEASAEPATWFRRTATNMGYPMCSAFYRRGVQQALGIEATEVWLVQEQDAPHLCSTVGLDAVGLEVAKRRMMRALRVWAACASVGRWPGYPADVAYPETPSWELAREEEHEGHAIPYDISKAGWREAIAAERAFSGLPE